MGNTMLAMVCSLLYQETYKYLTSLELVMFFVGFFTSIGGVVAMVWKEMGSDQDRTELWIQRLAASPRARRSPTRTAGLPPRHQKLYEDQFVLDTPKKEGDVDVDHEVRQIRGGVRSGNGGGGGSGGGCGGGGGGGRTTPTFNTTHPENIIDSNYRGPSPLSGVSSNGSINSSQGSPARYGVGLWKPIAVSEDLVDSLDPNQGNTSRLPYSHTLLNEKK